MKKKHYLLAEYIDILLEEGAKGDIIGLVSVILDDLKQIKLEVKENK